MKPFKIELPKSSNNEMTDKQFINAVARIRFKEMALFSKADIDQLMNCRNEKECLKYLADKGWGKDDDKTSEQVLSAELEKTWDLLKELVKDISYFDTFLHGNDYHNLKAAIKQVYKDANFPNIYLSNSTIDPEIIIKAVTEHDFSSLPEKMREVAEEAYQIQLRTGDSQLCDIVLDKAALDSIYSHGRATRNELISHYVELKVAAANINIAIRSVKTGKDEEFLKRALAECDSLDKTKLIECALEGMDAIYNYLSDTDYANGVPSLKESSQAFERWCDNRIIEYIRPQKYNPFTLSPLAAYLLARENEIKTVRILLSGKRNDISDDKIRERLREMYV